MKDRRTGIRSVRVKDEDVLSITIEWRVLVTLLIDSLVDACGPSVTRQVFTITVGERDGRSSNFNIKTMIVSINHRTYTKNEPIDGLPRDLRQ